ncbi:unnamed protein product, partial [Allacma fusca]
SSRCLYFRFW